MRKLNVQVYMNTTMNSRNTVYEVVKETEWLDYARK